MASVETAQSLLDLELDRRSPIPVYVQISEALRSLIQSGILDSDSVLPSPRLVCEKFGITRMTLRQAYAVLEREGLLDAQRGRGTFVRQPQIERALNRMVSFSEEMRSMNKIPSSKLLSFKREQPTADAASFLGKDPVYRIRRLRYADGAPIAIEQVEVPVASCPDLEEHFSGDKSLYDILEHVYKIRLGSCDQIVAAVVANPEDKKLLKIDASIALLRVTRNSLAASGSPATSGVTRYRGDCYTARVPGQRSKA